MSIRYVALAVLLVGIQTLLTALTVVDLRHGERAVARHRDELEELLQLDDPDRVLEYRRAITGIEQLRNWTVLGVLVAFVLGGGVVALADLVAETGAGPVGRGAVFAAAITIGVVLLVMPFGIVRTFVVDDLFDVNRRTVRVWARDTALRGVLLAGVAAVLGGGAVWLVETSPSEWWLFLWLSVVSLLVVVQLLYTSVITPLFNDLTPVEDEELRSTIDELVEQTGVACSNVYLMDASKQSGSLNAHVGGLGRTKRIVLYDTLVDALDRHELEAVLAHELGHIERRHFWKALAVIGVQLGLCAAVMGQLVATEWLYADLGLSTDSAYAGLLLAGLWTYPIYRATTPLRNLVSIRYEREADLFATKTIGSSKPLVEALSTLGTENLSPPYVHPVYAVFYRSHPTVPERIRTLQRE